MTKAKSRLTRKARSRLAKRDNRLKISTNFLLVTFFSGLLSPLFGMALSTHTIAETVKLVEVIQEKEVEKIVFSGYQPKNKIEEMLCQEKYGWNCEIMSAIAHAESGQNCQAINTTLNRDGSWDAGVLMVNQIHGHEMTKLLDCEYNIESAYKVWKSQGYRAWSVVKNGAYLKYLD